MKKKELLAFTFLIVSFIGTIVGTVFAQDDARLSATWQVQKYDISATLPQADTDRSLNAKAKLDLKNVSSRSASSLTLRISPNAAVTSVTVNGTTADFSKREEKLGSTSLQQIAVRIPSVAASGTISAVVDYKLTLKDNSGLAAISPVGSQFLPLSFWYPTPNSWYFARGADYSPSRVSITSNGQTVISTGIESAGAYDQKLKVQPFFVAGNFEKIATNGVEIFLPKAAGTEERKRAGEVAELATAAKTFIAAQVGNAPDVPIRIVFVKRGGGFSSGGTILVEENVLRRSKLDSAAAMALAEGIAKLWFADSQELSDDGYGAIREGLPRFFATQFIESSYGNAIADIERMRQRNAYANVSQRDAPIIQTVPLDDYYFSTVANKGSMIWRLLNRKIGADEFNKRLRSALQDGSVTLAEIRGLFPEQKEFLDAMFDKVTETNLLVGLPQPGAGETKVALRNVGSVDATVSITATFANGERMNAPATIRAASYGEVVFRTPNKIVRLEIDSEKLYPQTDYSDDIAPRETTDSDLLLAVKRLFDKQDFAKAESTAKDILRAHPNHDEVRILLGRSLLGLNRNTEAEKEFRAVLDEKLPTARSLAWANLGLAETAHRAGQSAPAEKFAVEAIRADADYGASLAARILKNKITAASAVPEDIKSYFTNFDRAAASNRKAEIDALVVPGEA
ncbi:MAG: tetratricopeptide repeat protein, partial [Pyrinomonadaceae bacterium]